MGFAFPQMDTVLYTAAGFIAPNYVASQIMGFIPTSWKTNTDGTPNQLTIWATKIAAVVLPAWALKRFVSPRAGSLFLIGATAGLLMDGVKTFAPSVATMLHLNGMGAQPLLGSYFQQPRQVANFASRARVPSMIADVPERLDPRARF